MTGPEALLSDPKLARLLVAMEATGCETRIVGGAVRDALLGIKPREIDLTTAALPEDVMAAARRAGLRSVPTGVEHGTVTVIVDGAPFEVTTLREDVETDGRFAKVRFGKDFAQDALRRDFTVNAISISTDGKLHDYADGLDDIKARRIRFIGDPARRIAEDYLRVLRFFRFHAAYGEGPLDPAGLHAAIVAREGLARLSAERVRAELLKLLSARRAVEVARIMSQNGVMEVVMGICFPARLERLAAIEDANGPEPDVQLRLAALGVLVEEDADRLRDRLRLSNAEHRRLSALADGLVGFNGVERPPSRMALLELLYLRGSEGARDVMKLAFAESSASPKDPQWVDALRFLRETPPPSFPIKGADLLARGHAPGKALGATLKTLQAKWIRAGFPRDPSVVMRLVEEAARSSNEKDRP